MNRNLLACIRIVKRNCGTSSVINPVKNVKVLRHTKRSEKELKIPPLNVNLAVDHLKSMCWAKFDETIEVAVNLGVDPRKPNQSIKGIATLPHGTGKTIRIGVFAMGPDADAAIKEGADVVGGADLIAKVQQGEINFDRVIATPEMMPQLSKIGRVSVRRCTLVLCKRMCVCVYI